MHLQQRDYQDRIVEKTVRLFQNHKSILIESPVGSGKTVIALRVVKELEEKYGIRTNWCAMRRNLLHQAREANDEFFGCKNIRFVSMFSKNPPNCDLLVQDEGHHAACASAVELDKLSGAEKILGLSATPFRTDKLSLSFQKTVRDAGIHRLIMDGYLSPYKHWAIEKWQPEEVAEVYLADRGKWGKSVAFFQQVSQCESFRDYLLRGGVTCEVVTAQTDRERQLDDFHQGKVDVLANVAILTEGFDEPELKSVFVRDSSRLPTIQMAGRGLRRHSDKPHCNIIQSQNAKWPFTRTATAQSCHVLKGGEWLTLGDTHRVIETAHEMGRKIATIDVHLPELLQENRKRRRRRLRA